MAASTTRWRLALVMSAVLATPSVALLPGRRRLAARLAFAVGVLVLLAAALAALPGLDEVRRRLGDAVTRVARALGRPRGGICLAFVVAYRGVLSRRLAGGVSYEVGMAVQGANVLLPTGGTTGLSSPARSGTWPRRGRLAAAFAAVGALPPMGVLVLAYGVGQLGGLIPLPGGVGGADGGLIAALAVYGTRWPKQPLPCLPTASSSWTFPRWLGTLALVRLPRVVSRLGQPPRSRATAPRAR